MVDRNVSKTLVSISLWTFKIKKRKKKRKENSLSDCLTWFSSNLKVLVGFCILLVAHVLQCQCIPKCLHYEFETYICKIFEIWLCYFERIKYGLG